MGLWRRGAIATSEEAVCDIERDVALDFANLTNSKFLVGGWRAHRERRPRTRPPPPSTAMRGPRPVCEPRFSTCDSTMASAGDSDDEVFMVNVHLAAGHFITGGAGARCEDSERKEFFESFPAARKQ